jgi:hypothetical protein
LSKIPSGARQRDDFLVRLCDVVDASGMNFVKLDQFARILGIEYKTAEGVALYLHEHGYIRVVPTSEGVKLRVTSKGIDRAEILAMPWWKRLFKSPAFISFVVAIACNLAIAALRWLIWETP